MLARILVALLLLTAPALAQYNPNARGGIQQGGSVTRGHVGVWQAPGVLTDAGPATNGIVSALGITGSGNVFCINSASPPTPYTQFCINLNGGALQFTDTSIGGAAHVPMQFIVNGFNGLTLNDSGFTLGGTLGVPSGGTGISSVTSGGLLIGNGASPMTILAPGPVNACVVSNGTAWVSTTACGGSSGGGTVTNVATGTGLTGGNITTTGTVSLANIAANTLLANTTGGSAAPVPTGLSAFIDSAIGLTRGGILERGLNGWAQLTPSSTPGTVLASNGTGTDPSYQAVVNSLTTTSGLTLSAASGNVAINLGPIANNTVMGNITGSANPAVAVTPSGLFDSSFGSVVGDLVTRTPGGWAALVPGTSGQVLQTQGAGVVPQWVTVTGTGTVTSVACGTGLSGGTITGSGTCSITAPVVVSLGGSGQTSFTAHGVLTGEGTSGFNATAAATTGQVLAGSTGADPAFGSLSSVVDTIGSTQGSVLYRGAALWSALGPGTAGQVLTSGGGSANPSWTSVTGTGTVTSVTCGTGLSGGTFTASGTCAITAPVTVALGGTGDTTLTANGVLYGAGTSAVGITAAGTNFQLLTATTGSPPAFFSPSAVLDGFSNAQGSVLYRGASAWTALGPGTSGQCLQSQGSGANLVWGVCGSGAGTITSVVAGTGLSGGGSSGAVTLNLSAPVAVANGGTGATSLTAHGVLIGEGTSAVLPTSAGTAGFVLTSNGSAADPTFQVPVSLHGAQIGIQIFSTPGSSTYTPDAGTNSVVVECLGAGGAGGGASTTTSAQNSVTPGGASGSYSRSNITSAFSGVTVVVGQGGTGVLGAAGNGGGSSSFGAILTCPGGGGGMATTPQTTAWVTAFTAPGATATGGNISNAAGTPGERGVCATATQCAPGSGASSVMGGGGQPTANNATGGAGGAAGAGGSGTVNVGSFSAVAGGQGGNGIVIVYELD